MRFLLALILMAPAFAQQAGSSSNAGSNSPAKADTLQVPGITDRATQAPANANSGAAQVPGITDQPAAAANHTP